MKTLNLTHKILIWLCVVLIAFATVQANATDKNKNGNVDIDVEADASAKSYADATATADANAAGGSASNGNMSSKNNFFALSTGFPQANECFGGLQIGGGGGDGGGLLGVHKLNKDCYYADSAGAEKSAEARALLKCASKLFRNAIAYQQPNREKQRYCVRYMTDVHLAEIKADASNTLQRENVLLRRSLQNLEEERAAEQRYAKEAAERCEADKAVLDSRCTK